MARHPMGGSALGHFQQGGGAFSHIGMRMMSQGFL